MNTLLLLHIATGGLLIASMATRFIKVVSLGKSAATLKKSVLGLTALLLASGVGLIFSAQASATRVCITALATIAILAVAEVTLQSIVKKRALATH